MSDSAFSRVCDLLNHKRAEVSWLVRAAVCYQTPDGRTFPTKAAARNHAGPGVRIRTAAKVDRLSRIVVVYPADGAPLTGRTTTAAPTTRSTGTAPPAATGTTRRRRRSPV